MFRVFVKCDPSLLCSILIASGPLLVLFLNLWNLIPGTSKFFHKLRNHHHPSAPPPPDSHYNTQRSHSFLFIQFRHSFPSYFPKYGATQILSSSKPCTFLCCAVHENNSTFICLAFPVRSWIFRDAFNPKTLPSFLLLIDYE